MWGGRLGLGRLGAGGGGLGLLLGRLVLLGGVGRAGGSGLGLAAVRRGPQGEVVPQELHDEGAIPIRLLRERVKLGDGVVKGLLGQVASAIGRVEDLVVEDREVQGEAETDGMGRRELGLGDVGGVLRLELVLYPTVY